MNKKELLSALEGVADNAAIVVVQSAGEGHYNCSPVEGVQYNQATASVYKENSPEPHVIYRLSASHFCIVPKLLPPAPTIKGLEMEKESRAERIEREAREVYAAWKEWDLACTAPVKYIEEWNRLYMAMDALGRTLNANVL